MRYVGRLGGAWPGTRSMRWSMSRLGGNPLGKSSGNTSLNSLIMALALSDMGSLLSLLVLAPGVTSARYNCSPFCTSRLICSADTTSMLVLLCSLIGGNTRGLPLYSTVTVPVLQLICGLCRCNHVVPNIISWPING